MEGNALESVMARVLERLRINNHNKDNAIVWLFLVPFTHWRKSLEVINH